MTYLDLAPAITAIRSRPEEFEFSFDMLHHRPSRHHFRFITEDEVRIDAACDCSLLRATPEQTRTFHAAFREWRASYWRGVEINREFASHFETPLWRRCAIWLLQRLIAWPSPRRHAHHVANEGKQAVAA
jgi:hypothetical protein